MTTYYLLRLGSLVSRVVPLPALYALAHLVARAADLLPTRARGAARANIAHVMGQPIDSPAVRQAATCAFRCQAFNYVDLMRLGRVTLAELDAQLVLGDLSPLLTGIAGGKGVIVISAHLGNVDYVVQWLVLQGHCVHTAMERLRPQRLFDLVRRQRESVGLQLHPAEPGALGALTAALRRGAVVALVADRDVSGTGQPAEFFGAPARLPTGAVLLGLRTGAPLVPTFAYRLRDARLFVSARPAVTLRHTRALRDDLQHGLHVLARLLEEGIARAPEQWVVFEPIWKDGAA
jgi:phosphatidylinositol dimannoside acyltransferase